MDIESERAQVRDCLDRLWAALKQGDPRDRGVISPECQPRPARRGGGHWPTGHRAAIRGAARPRPGAAGDHDHLKPPDPPARPDVAIVDAASQLTQADASGDQHKLGDVFFTIVAVKDEQGWRLAAVRGADPSNLSDRHDADGRGQPVRPSRAPSCSSTTGR